MKPKLTYFDAPISRGEECRLALSIAGVDFEDVRLTHADWPRIKPTTPFGSLPIFEMPGQPMLAQSNAILMLIGRRHGLHPKDEMEAARHEGILEYVEELRGKISPTLRMSDEAEKKKAREALATSDLPTWGANVEKQIGDGPFLAGGTIHVADIKLHMVVRWLAGGKVDHIPATVFSPFPKLIRLHDAVRDHERVKAWYARS